MGDGKVRDWRDAAWLHVYAQPVQHEPAEIRGTREALTAMRDAIDAALAGGVGTASAFASDGEGFAVNVQRVEVLSLLGPLPYTDEGWPRVRHEAWAKGPASIACDEVGPEPVRWRCFHCDEAFTASQERWAREHFGRDETAEPVCLIRTSGEGALLSALREAEDQLASYRAEDGAILKAMWAMQSDHRRALVREEELGYERGLRDGRALEG